MGESACLRRSFSHPSDASREAAPVSSPRNFSAHFAGDVLVFPFVGSVCFCAADNLLKGVFFFTVIRSDGRLCGHRCVTVFLDFSIFEIRGRENARGPSCFFGPLRLLRMEIRCL